MQSRLPDLQFPFFVFKLIHDPHHEINRGRITRKALMALEFRLRDGDDITRHDVARSLLNTCTALEIYHRPILELMRAIPIANVFWEQNGSWDLLKHCTHETR